MTQAILPISNRAGDYFSRIKEGIASTKYYSADIGFAILAQISRANTSSYNFGVSSTPDLEWLDITGSQNGFTLYEGDIVYFYVGMADLATSRPVDNWHSWHGESLYNDDIAVVTVGGFVSGDTESLGDSAEFRFREDSIFNLNSPEVITSGTNVEWTFRANDGGLNGNANSYYFGEFSLHTFYTPDVPGAEDKDNDNPLDQSQIIDIDGIFFNPEFNFNNDLIKAEEVSASFTYVDLADDAYLSAPPTYAPIAVDDLVYISPGTSQVYVDVLANDNDPDGSKEDLTVTLGFAPSTGTAEVVGNQILYRPGDDFQFADALVYEVTDADGLTRFASVSFSSLPFFLFGFDEDDDLTGSNFGDEFEAGAGNDVLRALAGDDILNGQDGDDILFGDLGDDVLIGGQGVDVASYANALNYVEVYLNAGLSRGADGRDRLSDVENLTGSDFDDRLIGDAGDNVLRGGAGDDILKSKGGTDLLFGETGNDRLRGGEGIDTLSGDAGNDILLGLANDDLLDGGEGDDFLYGGRDSDTLLGGIGADVLRGNRGNDVLFGDGHDDDLRGGGGNDVLTGGDGNDYLLGGNGSDDLVGGDGDDVLLGGYGAGQNDGVRDVFIINPFGGFDRIRDFENGIDVLDLSGFGFTDFAQISGLAVNAGASAMRLNFDDTHGIYIDNFRLSDLDASDVVLA